MTLPAIGDYVRIEGEIGKAYKVLGFNLKDGSIELYGGDPNPKGQRGFRAVRPERLRPALAKHVPKDGAQTER